MAHASVVEAVEAKLAAEWSQCPVVGINTVGEAPQDGSPYLLVQYPAASTARVAVNEGYYREEGGIRFVMHLSPGEGIARANLWAGILARMFRYAEFGGVKTEAPTSPFYDDSNDAGAYFLATVLVPYTYDYEDNGDSP